jgi:ABC-type amino acid transport substrate-binding protein
MKKYLHALVSLFIVMGCLPAYAETSTLVIARIENIPDQYVGGEILKVVYSSLNVNILFADMPAKRALIESSQGRVDGEVQRVLDVGNEYPSLIAAHPSINYIEPSVFIQTSKKEQFPTRIAGWDSIRNYRIGIVNGVGSSERGTAGMPHVFRINTLDTAMEMLAVDRLDIVVSDRFSGLVSIAKQNLTGISSLSPPLQKIEIYHFLHKKHSALLPKVEKVLAEMSQTGELERLRAKLVKQYLDDSAKR